MSIFKRFFVDDRGTETVEWGILAGLIIGGLIAAFTAIGVWAKGQIEGLQTEMGA
jgi:Flp pilus assembly pilin Flp